MHALSLGRYIDVRSGKPATLVISVGEVGFSLTEEGTELHWLTEQEGRQDCVRIDERSAGQG